MEEVTSVAETPADCGIVLNWDEYFPQLNGTPIFVARSIAIIICYKTFGGSKLNFKVESFADLEKRFFVANVLIRTTTLPLSFVRSSVNFFYNDRRWHASISSTRTIGNTCCTSYVLVFSPIHYGFHFHGHQSWNMFNCNFIRWKFNFVSINSQTRSQSTQRRFITEKRHINLITAMVTSCVLGPTSCWSWLSMLTMGGPGGKVFRSPFKCTLARNAVCHLGEETTCKWRLWQNSPKSLNDVKSVNHPEWG